MLQSWAGSRKEFTLQINGDLLPQGGKHWWEEMAEEVPGFEICSLPPLLPLVRWEQSLNLLQLPSSWSL